MITEPLLNLGTFAGFLLLTLFAVYQAGNRSTTGDDFAAGGGFNGPQNGVALTAAFLSAAAFLGIAGAVAVHGSGAFLYAAGFLVAWLVNLLVIAEPLRNTNSFTLGDMLSWRLHPPPVRVASAVSTVTVSFFCLVANMAGAGGLVAFLLDVHSSGGQALVITVVGVMMVAYVFVGGMTGTARPQIIKAGLLLTCLVMLTAFLLGKFGFDLGSLLREAGGNRELGERAFGPGSLGEGSAKLELVSLSLALMLGVAGLPHVLMRSESAPNAREARRPVVWVICVLTACYLCTLIVGYAAAAIAGSDAILSAPGRENSAVPLLASEIGGPLLLGLVAAIAFATILSVVVGFMLIASASFAQDIYSNVYRGGCRQQWEEVRVARWAALVLGGASIVGAVLVNGQNTAFLVGLAFAFAASANVPPLLLALFWKRFNTRGALWSLYGGLGACSLLVALSPVVSGTPLSVLPAWDFALFPLNNPAIVSVPFSFLCGVVGTLAGGGRADTARAAEVEVRALTGLDPR
ncbi:solute symporter family protein [Parasphingorhabdus pacifica]